MLPLTTEERRIDRREWLWVGAVSLLLMLAFSLPYLVGWLNSTPDMAFGGALFAVDDINSYLAKMRYGARHGWLFQLVYTTEPHDGGFIIPHLLGLGKLAALLSGEGAKVSARTLIIAYHAARIVCGLALLGVLYRFVADYLSSRGVRRLAWALASAVAGLGWLTTLGGADSLPLEFYVPEAFSLLQLYGLPHLALARALLLGGWLLLFRALETGRYLPAAGAGLCWLGMSLIVPFYAALLGVLIVVWLVALSLLRREIALREFRYAAVGGALPAATLVYNALLFTRNPVFATWSAQNQLSSPPPVDFVLAYGPLIILAAVGAATLLRRGVLREAAAQPRWALLLTWPPIAAILVALPINVQRRLLEGVVVPLAVLAALGAGRLVGAPGEGRARMAWWARQAALAVVFVLLAGTPVLLIAGGAALASAPQWPIFHPADELAALNWLRDHAPADSHVLSTFESGNVLPAHAGVRVVVGHGPETVNALEKKEQAPRFFHGGMTDAERQALLSRYGVRYVWVGPPEWPETCDAHCFDPAALGLRAVFTAGDYAIYEVSAS
ncbi:MAG TPA: hypothetical protein PK801_03840 [Aggregatilineales bacterium]|nr:hypothetical protein [Aggregatilineales bacterium]